jgi:hypothetical protein
MFSMKLKIAKIIGNNRYVEWRQIEFQSRHSKTNRRDVDILDAWREEKDQLRIESSREDI